VTQIKGTAPTQYEFRRLSPRQDGTYEYFAWQAAYETSAYSQTSQSRKPIQFEIEGVRTKECPVSLITPESRRAVEEIAQAMRVQSETGAAPGGTDTRNWPARWFDLVRVWKSEHNRIDNAKDQAEQSFNG
jgi:hypothetical protein